jgi:hypothetical protein
MIRKRYRVGLFVYSTIFMDLVHVISIHIWFSGASFLPKPKHIILNGGKYTKIYIRERRITCQSNFKRRKSLSCTVGPGGNTEWDY